MKRSKSLSLLLMGGLALGASGCDSGKKEAEQETYKAFSSIEECVGSGLFSDTECRDFMVAAKSQTPKFGTKEACEGTFGEGACEERGGISKPTDAQAAAATPQSPPQSSWMPMMAGFMAGRYLSGGSPMQGAQPLYRDPCAGNLDDPRCKQNTSNRSSNSRSGSGGSGALYRTATGDAVQTDAKGTVTNPSPKVRQGFGYSAKAAAPRASIASSGGFSGGKMSFGS